MDHGTRRRIGQFVRPCRVDDGRRLGLERVDCGDTSGPEPQVKGAQWRGLRKFYLHASREERRRRFLVRLERPEKHWKLSTAGVAERDRRDACMQAGEDAIRATAAPQATGFMVPADNKWYTRRVVSLAIEELKGSLNLHHPELGAAQARQIKLSRVRLRAKGAAGGKGLVTGKRARTLLLLRQLRFAG